MRVVLSILRLLRVRGRRKIKYGSVGNDISILNGKPLSPPDASAPPLEPKRPSICPSLQQCFSIPENGLCSVSFNVISGRSVSLCFLCFASSYTFFLGFPKQSAPLGIGVDVVTIHVLLFCLFFLWLYFELYWDKQLVSHIFFPLVFVIRFLTKLRSGCETFFLIGLRSYLRRHIVILSSARSFFTLYNVPLAWFYIANCTFFFFFSFMWNVTGQTGFVPFCLLSLTFCVVSHT